MNAVGIDNNNNNNNKETSFFKSLKESHSSLQTVNMNFYATTAGVNYILTTPDGSKDFYHWYITTHTHTWKELHL